MDHSNRMTNFRGVFPGAFTMGNMLCGFLSIVASHSNQLARAAWLIVLAAFVDALDGRVARLSGSTSKFGKELDSLADVISFGLAPAFMIYIAVLDNFEKMVGMVVAVVFIMCGASRLARYNVIADPHRKDAYVGLPIPTAAICISSYVILCLQYFKEIRYPEFLVSMVVALSALMISTVSYDTLPERFDSLENRWRMVGVFVFLVAVLIKPRLMIFPFVALYIALGLLREMWRILTGYRRTRKERTHDPEF